MAKYGHEDMRNVLERASARETVGRVAGGAVCKRLLAELGVTVKARVTAIGPVAVSAAGGSGRPAVDRLGSRGGLAGGVRRPRRLSVSDVRSDRPGARGRGVARRGLRGLVLGSGAGSGRLRQLWKTGWTAVSWERSAPSRPSKAAEIGYGFAQAALPGSQVHDPFEVRTAPPVRPGSAGTSNNAGGLEGGMTTGMPLVVRAAMKPIPTLTTPLPSVDLADHEGRGRPVERSDVCAVPAARVVGEAMVAYVLAGGLSGEVRGRQPGRSASGRPRLRGASGGPGSMAPFVALAGFMGSGKSSVGARGRAAARLAVRGPRRGDRRDRGHAHRRVLRPLRRGGVPAQRGRGARGPSSRTPGMRRCSGPGLVLALGGGTLQTPRGRRLARGARRRGLPGGRCGRRRGSGPVATAGRWRRIAEAFRALLAARRADVRDGRPTGSSLWATAGWRSWPRRSPRW